MWVNKVVNNEEDTQRGRWQEDVLRIPQGVVIFQRDSSRPLMTFRVL